MGVRREAAAQHFASAAAVSGIFSTQGTAIMPTNSGRTLVGIAASLAVCYASLCCANLRAATNDTQKFVEALRQRRYFDTASEYLEHLANDAHASTDAKRSLPYEQAVLLMEAAGRIRDADVRDAQFEQAESKLKDFITANLHDELAADARNRLANLLRYRAATAWSKADQPSADKSKLRTFAETKYSQARSTYDDLVKQYRSQLDAIPKGEQQDQRMELGGKWIEAMLNSAEIAFEVGRIQEPGSSQRKKLLTEAAEQCSTLHERFPKLVGGGYARLYEGRCYEELGDR
ncbi:MAG TPA: hypothetical protein VGJ15_01730, partial [Pirellulales bacterium]